MKSKEIQMDIQRTDKELQLLQESKWRATMVEIGRRLQEQRKALGYTQTELGDRVGLTSAAISEFERGNYSPSLDTFFNLCDTMLVSSDYILYGKTPDKPLPSIVEKILRMSESERALVEAILPELHWLHRFDDIETEENE